MASSIPISWIVPRGLGIVLLTAAALTGHELATTATFDSLLTARWQRIAAVELEFALGLWLVSGLCPRVALWVALVTFATFAGVAASKIVAGEASCGCFGRVAINPWATLAFDVVAVVALALMRFDRSPSAPTVRSHFRRAVLVLTTGLLAGGAGALAMATFEPAKLSDEGDFIGDAATVVLEPGSWMGRRFPLQRHIDGGDPLRAGRWLVMLYHHDCAVCQQAMPRMLQLAYDWDGRSGAPRVALIEIPPFAGQSPDPAGSPCLRCRLSEERTWQVQTPVFLSLQDGRVTEISRSAEQLLPGLGAGVTEGHLTQRNGSEPLSPDQERQRRLEVETACGPLALLAVLQSLGVPPTPEEANQLLAVAVPSHGTSLLQLKELAEARGLHALGANLTREKLEQIGLPAIIHDGRAGFAAATRYTADGIQLYFPPGRRVIFPAERFDKQFGQSFRVLVVSDQPLSAEKLGIGGEAPPQPPGPHLALGRSVLIVSRIFTVHWQATLALRNDGDAPLEIQSVQALCRGYRASVDVTTLPPGGRTELRVAGSEPEPGRIACSIQVKTNEPGRPEVIVPVRGLQELAIRPESPALNLGEVYVNRSAESEVSLNLVEEFRDAQVAVEVPSGAPLAATVQRHTNGHAKIHLHWLGSDKIGWQRFRLGVKPAGIADAAAAPLLVAVQIVPEVEVFPPSLWIADEEVASNWSRRVTFRFRGPAPDRYELSATDPRFLKAVKVELIETKGSELTVRLSPTSASDFGNWRGHKLGLQFRFAGKLGVTQTIYVGSGGFGAPAGTFWLW